MQWKTETVTVDGEAPIHLRELSAGAAEAVERAGGTDLEQSINVLALSLCSEDGAPLYTCEQLDEAAAHVRDMPIRFVREVLVPSVMRLNSGTMDDARGN